MHYFGWDSGQPRGTAERGCVAVAEETSFLWFTEECDTAHHFVCQKRMLTCSSKNLCHEKELGPFTQSVRDNAVVIKSLVSS